MDGIIYQLCYPSDSNSDYYVCLESYWVSFNKTIGRSNIDVLNLIKNNKVDGTFYKRVDKIDPSIMTMLYHNVETAHIKFMLHGTPVSHVFARVPFSMFVQYFGLPQGTTT